MRLIRIAAVVLALLVGLLVAAYAVLPGAAAWFAPRVAADLGLLSLELTLRRPGLERLEVDTVVAEHTRFRLEAHDLQLSYSWETLRNRRLERVHMERATLTVHPPADGPSQDAAAVPPAGALFALVPAAAVEVDELSLGVPELAFTASGPLTVAGERLRLELLAHSPEAAEGLSLSVDLSASGALELALARPEAAGDAFVRVATELPEQALRGRAAFILEGYVLDLVSALAGLPAGAGTIAGELQFDYPWPVPAGLDPDALAASGPVALDWTSRDGRFGLQALKGIAALADGRLVMTDLSGSLVVQAGGYGGSFEPERLVVERGGPTVSVSGRLSRLSVEDDLRANGRLELDLNVDGDRLQADGRFDGTAVMDERRFPLTVEGAGSLLDQQLDAMLTVSSGVVQRAPVKVRYGLDSGAIEASVTHRLPFSKPLLAELWPPWEQPYDLESGSLTLDATLSRREARWSGSATLELANVAAHYGDTAIRGAAGRLSVRLADAAPRLDPSLISAALVDVGVPVESLHTTVGGDLRALSFQDTSARVLGGGLSIEPFRYDLEAGSADLRVQLADLDLTQILALEGDDIGGDGRLDGTLPVALRDGGVSVAGGRLVARPPGGTLRLNASLVSAFTQPGLDLALGALTDFRFEVLNADVDYQENGDLALGVQLEGHNPAVEKGRRIIYNLNVTENVPVLLESLRLQEAFTRRIEQRVRR